MVDDIIDRSWDFSINFKTCFFCFLSCLYPRCLFFNFVGFIYWIFYDFTRQKGKKRKNWLSRLRDDIGWNSFLFFMSKALTIFFTLIGEKSSRLRRVLRSRDRFISFEASFENFRNISLRNWFFDIFYKWNFSGPAWFFVTKNSSNHPWDLLTCSYFICHWFLAFCRFTNEKSIDKWVKEAGRFTTWWKRF